MTPDIQDDWQLDHDEDDTDREYNFKWWGIVIGLGLVFWGSLAAAWLI